MQAIGVGELRGECKGGAYPGTGEAYDGGFACGAVVAEEVKGFFGPLGFLAFVYFAGFGECGAEHGGEADGTGVVAAEDKGMSGGLNGWVRKDERRRVTVDVRSVF